MRKPPEMLVMLAPAALVTALVLAFGFLMGGGGGSDRADRTAGSVSPSVSAPASPPTSPPPSVKSEAGSTQVKLPGPGVVIKAKPRPRFRTYQPYSFTISSFNVLGHSHTVSGGDASGYPDSSIRMGWTLSGLSSAGVDLVGLQELQPPQLSSLLRRAGSTYGVWPGASLGRWGIANSIAWRKDTFELVDAKTIEIPYFGGQGRVQPYLLLRHRATGQQLWIANFHNPANHGSTAANTRYRRIATGREITLANNLAKTGYPVFFTGDFNERAEYFCPLTGGTALKAANGGSTSGTCVPPRQMPVDWIFGSDNVAFSRYAALKGGVLARASDHPMVVADVSVPKKKEPIVRKKKP